MELLIIQLFSVFQFHYCNAVFINIYNISLSKKKKKHLQHKFINHFNYIINQNIKGVNHLFNIV